MTTFKIVVAALGSLFVGFWVAGFAYLFFWKSAGWLAFSIGLILSLELFRRVCNSILETRTTQPSLPPPDDKTSATTDQ